MQQATDVLTPRCACGSVAFELRGSPIGAAACYCHSCQKAGHEIEQLPGAPRVVQADGGTPYLLYRRDRVTCVKGAERLSVKKLKPESKTERIVATCCNSAMFVTVTNGHWQSFYRNRIAEGAPAIEMRVMTRDKPEGVTLPADIPNYKGFFAGSFMWKILTAWVAMKFSR